MTVPSSAEFLSRFPEFGEQSTSVVEGALAEAGRSANAEVWGTVHTDAVSYLAAHLLAIRTMQIGLQVEAQSGSPAGEGLAATLYGQEYQRLLTSRPICGFAL
ncbi:MAG: DUF4054 domain-containing protein [Pontimonas sp.]|jgi:hypothetical protein